MNEPADEPRSAQGAYGIAGEYVSSQRVYELETRAIFSCHWVCVARTEELHPESGCLPIRFENHGLILTQDETGTIRAFRNFCRHRGSQLVNEANCGLLGKRIQCPYHAWTYDRAGKLVSAPNMTGVETFHPEDNGLMEVACERFGGFVWINFNPRQGLRDWLGKIADRFEDWHLNDLRIAHEIKYPIAANWKLIFQNYSECYHCPTVHPMLNRLTPYRGASNDLKTGPILGGPMSLAEGSQTMSSDGKFVGLPIAGLSPVQSRSVHYLTLFPTLFLSLHPDYVLIHRIERMGVGQSKVVCQFLFHPDSIRHQGFDPGPAVDFWDLTNRQDWEVCELAQIGMSDPAYRPGPYSNLESVVAAFDRHYLETLEAVQPTGVNALS